MPDFFNRDWKGEKNIPGSVSYLDPRQKLMGSIVGSRPVLHPSFVEVHSVVFVKSCWQTDQQATKQKNKR